jgi:serine/threonine-protein kinase
MSDRNKRMLPSLDGYRFHRLLGSGGMGEVWLASDITLGRQVAVKLIRQELANDPEFADRFFNEMKTVAKFRHPNIGRVYGTGRTSDGRLAMIMELLEGESLRQIIDAQPPGEPFDIVRAAYFTIQVLEAVQEAHEQGIQHRDIKPENVIVQQNGHLWLVDFGVATRRQTTGEVGKRTETPKQSTLMGTARYMAPELLEHGRSDNRSDLYAVGVMLYHMLTGEFPHPGIKDDDETKIVAAHIHLEPTPISEVRKDCEGALEGIIAKLLAKDPDLRYQSAEEAIIDLSMLVRGSLPPDDPIAKKLVKDREQKQRRAAFAKHVAREEASRHVPRAQGSAPRENTPPASTPAPERPAQLPQVTKPLPQDFVPPSPTLHSTEQHAAPVPDRSTVPMGPPKAVSGSSPYFRDNQQGSRDKQHGSRPGVQMPSNHSVSPTRDATSSRPATAVATAPPHAEAHATPAPVAASSPAAAVTGPLPEQRESPAGARAPVPSTSLTDPGWERERLGPAREKRSPLAANPRVRQLAAAISVGVALAVVSAVVLLRGRSIAASSPEADGGTVAATTAAAPRDTDGAPPRSDEPATSAPTPATASEQPAPAPEAPKSTASVARVETPPLQPRTAPRAPATSAPPRSQPRPKPTAAPLEAIELEPPPKKPEAPAQKPQPASNRMFGTED